MIIDLKPLIKTFLIGITFCVFLLDYVKDLYFRTKAVFKALREGDDDGQRST